MGVCCARTIAFQGCRDRVGLRARVILRANCLVDEFWVGGETLLGRCVLFRQPWRAIVRVAASLRAIYLFGKLFSLTERGSGDKRIAIRGVKSVLGLPLLHLLLL